MFPGDHDEAVELESLWKCFAGVLERESNGGEKGKQRDVEGKVDYAESSDGDRVGKNEDDDDDEEATGSMALKREIEHEDIDVDMDVEMVDGEENLDDAIQLEGDHEDQGLRKTWHSMDGTMAIYPPNDDLEDVELAAEVAKAAVTRVASVDLLAQFSEYPYIPRSS